MFLSYRAEEAYIYDYVARSGAKLPLQPPFSFSDDESDEAKSRIETPQNTPPRNKVVTIELRFSPEPVEEKEDAFSYQPATDA